jgi:hypothetical protein
MCKQPIIILKIKKSFEVLPKEKEFSLSLEHKEK